MGVVPDERLARRAARGDRRAFEAIYRRYDQPLYRFCLAMVGNPQDAQDALQNTMVKALRALPGEERQIKLKPWLYRIARNESVEVLRRRREGAELDPEQEAVDSVAETAEARERLRHLLGDLDQLHERQRSVLVMRELSGLGFAEIGAALGTSAAAARQALYEARLSLRQMEAGREMRCADVMRKLSDADGRISRRREIRAHLRGCPQCRSFQEEIGRRRGELAAVAPLPLALSAGLLKGVLGAQAGTGAASAGAGAAVATSTVVKTAATVAVATVVGVSAADRGGLVDLPRPGDRGGAVTESAAPTAPKPALPPPGGTDAGGPAVSTPRPVRSARQAAPARQAERRRAAAGQDQAPVTNPQSRQSTPPDSSAGTNPPGGGFGATAAKRRGRPEALPEAASHGQQRAASRRPSHAGRPSSPGKPAAPPQAKVVPQPKPPTPPPHPLAPPATEKAPPPSQAGGKPVQKSSPPAESVDSP